MVQKNVGIVAKDTQKILKFARTAGIICKQKLYKESPLKVSNRPSKGRSSHPADDFYKIFNISNLSYKNTKAYNEV